MKKENKSQHEVWVQFFVSKKCVDEIHSFFRTEYAIEPEVLISNLHLTIYHSRGPMFNLKESIKNYSFSIDTIETRFMVLAPGGENPRPEIIPSNHKIGIRIKKSSNFRNEINKYRKTLFIHETKEILGKRNPSTITKNAFGARNFQPHISILKSDNGISTDLTEIGNKFRESIPEIKFDKYIIHKRKNF